MLSLEEFEMPFRNCVFSYSELDIIKYNFKFCGQMTSNNFKFCGQMKFSVTEFQIFHVAKVPY